MSLGDFASKYQADTTLLKIFKKKNPHHTIRLMQIGRELRRPLMPSPAQSRANTKCRPGFSGLCPDRSWKPPRKELPQCLWTALSILNCLHSVKLFLYSHSKLSLFQFMTTHPPVMHLCKEPGSIFPTASSPAQAGCC